MQREQRVAPSLCFVLLRKEKGHVSHPASGEQRAGGEEERPNYPPSCSHDKQEPLDPVRSEQSLDLKGGGGGQDESRWSASGTTDVERRLSRPWRAPECYVRALLSHLGFTVLFIITLSSHLCVCPSNEGASAPPDRLVPSAPDVSPTARK